MGNIGKAKIIALMMAFLLPVFNAVAQEETVEEQANGVACFTVEDLVQLLHMSFHDAYEVLDAKGYQMGFFSDKSNGEQYDTIGDEVLTYSRMAFNDIANRRSAMWLYASKDGLCNVVEWVSGDPGDCSLFAVFHQHGYVYDRASGKFHGSGLYKGVMEHYEVQYREDSSTLRLKMRNIREIENYVAERREAREKSLLEAVDQARLMAAEFHYLPALAILDSLNGSGWKIDSVAAVTRQQVVELAEKYYLTKLDAVMNTNIGLGTGVAYCDTLLMIFPEQDSVRQIREVLQAQISGEVARYSELCPDEFAMTVKALEKILNTELRLNAIAEEQRMRMSFTFQTSNKNESFGRVSITMGNAVTRPNQENSATRGRMIQRSVDELAHSEVIKPVRQHGVYVATRDQVSADVRWKYYTMQVIDTCTAKNLILNPAVQYIDDHYFSTFDTIRSSLSQYNDNVMVRGKVRKPTKRIYTFGITEKRTEENYYTDISLIKFSTTGFFDWTPSILIPGVGTKNQGLHSVASARAIPFFLFGALSVAGFAWEKNGGTRVERPTLAEGGAEMPWHYKNFGYYLGYGAAAIAATIYINELVEGISCGFRNLHRSKALRKQLKRGSITVQTEDVRLK